MSDLNVFTCECGWVNVVTGGGTKPCTACSFCLSQKEKDDLREKEWCDDDGF